jgi:ABC-2 type transport system permease protein
MKELYAYRDLIRALVARELKVRYRRSAIGFLWTMLQPMLMMVVLGVVFSSIFRFQFPEGNYVVYVLSGLLFWNFFSQSIVSAMNSLRGNSALLKKLPIPKEVFPLAAVISGVVNLVLAFLPLLAILWWLDHPMNAAMLFLPVSVLIAAAFTLGAGLLLSPLAVFFSDVVELVGVLLAAMMYLTPVIYPKEIVPERFLPIIRFNPIRSVLEVFRDPIFYGKVPPMSHLTVALAISIGMMALGMVVFRKSSDRIPFYI